MEQTITSGKNQQLNSCESAQALRFRPNRSGVGPQLERNRGGYDIPKGQEMVKVFIWQFRFAPRDQHLSNSKT
jgi:hypothetical protein